MNELLYQTFDVNLYKRSDAITVSDATPNGGVSAMDLFENSTIQGNVVDPEGIVSGSIAGNLEYTGGYIQSANYVAGTSGWRLSSDGTLKAVNATLSGNITAASVDIPDASTANSFHIDTSGNTWWGATTLANSLASVTAAGVMTAIGMTSLNKKAYTNFESSGRFISSVGGTGSNTFGNQGVTISPGATATSYSRLLWDISNVFSNNPTFTCTIYALSLNAASGDGGAFIGMGNPTVSGGGYTMTPAHIGFSFRKNGSTVNVSTEVGDGTSVGTNAVTTITDSDVIELFIKVTATSVKFYYRKNGGTLTLADTITTHIPTSPEAYLHFSTTNYGTAQNMQLVLQCAAYEH